MQLLYYGGAGWCIEAEQLFRMVIEKLAEQEGSRLADDLNWVIATLEAKALVPLQQMCIWNVRKALGMQLAQKVPELGALLPESIRDAITWMPRKGAGWEENKVRYFNRWGSLSITEEDVLPIFVSLLDSPSRIFLPFSVNTRQPFTLVDILALSIPDKYLNIFLYLLEAAIERQQQTNPESLQEHLLAALNCAILRNCTPLMHFLLEKHRALHDQTPRQAWPGAQGHSAPGQQTTLISGPSPFALANVLEDGDHLAHLPRRLRESLVAPTTAMPISPLVVACLANNCEALELLRARQLSFSLVEVVFAFT